MKRIITEKLVKWKNSKYRKPLIVRGARQVGKTHTIMEFGKANYKGNLHLIDLEKYPSFCKIFERDLDTKRILSEIEISIEKKIDTKKDLLFIDEIQNCKKALASLRYFYEEMPELHLIVAGSLIEFALGDISFPVGRVQTITMHPMNLYEYLIAMDKKISADAIITSPKNISENQHEKLLTELKNYFFVGGMPEAVKIYRNTGKLLNAFEVQRDLVVTFREDFSKYAGRADKTSLNNVFLSTAQSVGNQIKYSNLAEGFTVPTIKNSFELLLNAKLINKVKAASPAGLPLGASASNKKFKAVYLDIGLMQQVCNLKADVEYTKNDLLAIYKGALAEQFVGQEFLSSFDTDLFYWSRESKSSSAEVDYLISLDNEIYPIEVKSGSEGKLKSLHLLLEHYRNVKKSFVFSNRMFIGDFEQRIIFLPLYFAYGLAQGFIYKK